MAARARVANPRIFSRMRSTSRMCFAACSFSPGASGISGAIQDDNEGVTYAHRNKIEAMRLENPTL